MKRPLARISHTLALLACTIAASCASSSAPPTRAPELTSVPSLVVEAFCTKLHSEGVASGGSIAVISTSQPIITGASLRSLAHAYYRDGELGGIAEVINAALKPVKVDLAGSRSCDWTAVDKLDPEKLAQTPVVEFSAPFPNPFAKGESGVLARMSIGDRDAQWYWIPIAERRGVIGVGMVLPMDMPSS